MIKKRLLVLASIIASLFSGIVPPQSVYACSLAGLGDYQLTSQNGQFIYLVFKPDYPIRNIDLYTKYKNTGLYRNDGTTERLWTAGNVTPEAVISNDGRHLIELSAATATFYNDGQEVRHYSQADFGITDAGSSGCSYVYEKRGEKAYKHFNGTNFWVGQAIIWTSRTANFIWIPSPTKHMYLT